MKGRRQKILSKKEREVRERWGECNRIEIKETKFIKEKWMREDFNRKRE